MKTILLILSLLLTACSKSPDALLRKAERGSAKAQCQLGKAFQCGNGVEQDMQAAEKWLLRSAEQGYAEAQFHLAALVRFDSRPLLL